MQAPPRTPAVMLARCAIAALALYKLAYHAVYLTASPFAHGTFSDGRIYEDAARDLLAHPPLGTQPFYLQGLYAYLLAFGLWLGRGLAGALALQVAAVALAYAAFYRLAVRTFGPLSGALSTLCLLAYPGLTFYENKPLSAAIGIACNIGALYACERFDAAPGRARAGLLGVWSGLAMLARPNMALALPLGLACALARVDRAGRRAPFALAFAAGAALSLAPMALRNGAVTGHYDVARAQGGGIAFYVGNNPYAKGLINNAGGLLSGQVGVEQLELPEKLGLPYIADRSDRAKAVGHAMYAKALAYITSDPAGWLKLSARKLWLTLGNEEISQDYDVLGEQTAVPAWLRVGLPFAALLALGVAGIGAVGRTRMSLALWLALGQGAVVIATNIAFFTSFQHRLPLAVPLALFAGPGLYALAGLLRGERPVRLLAVAAAAAMFALVPARPTRTRVSTAHYFNLAMVEEQRGDFASAAAQLGRAVERAPDLLEIRIERARLLRLTGRLDLAEQELAAVAQRAPLPGWIAATLAHEREQLARAKR